jgi:hypothetical protein
MSCGVLATLLACGGPAQADPPFLRAVDERVELPVDRAVGDLLILGGSLNLNGVVRGHIFAVDADVSFGPDALVLGSVSLLRGGLKVDPQARLPAEVALEGVHVHGQGLQPGQRRALPSGAVLVQAPTTPSDGAVALMKDVLAFDRFAPADGMDVRDLRGWHPGLGLTVKRFVERPPQVVVGGVTRLSFVSDKVLGAFQRGYRGDAGSVLLTGVRLVDVPTAQALWGQVESVEDQAGVELSVKSDLGPGAHWFFRKKGRYVTLWQRGPWFFGVETRLAKPGATPEEEKQFLDQVLASLRQGLSPVAGSASVSRGK